MLNISSLTFKITLILFFLIQINKINSTNNECEVVYNGNKYTGKCISLEECTDLAVKNDCSKNGNFSLACCFSNEYDSITNIFNLFDSYEDDLTNNLDLAILIDSSKSIGYYDFGIIKDTIINYLYSYNNIINDIETRIAIMHFDESVHEVVNLNNFIDFENVINSISAINYVGDGERNTALALKHANDQIFQENFGMRPDQLQIPRVILLITTGDSINQTETLKESKLLKDRAIRIVTLGIFKDGINYSNEYINIATSKEDSYKIDDPLNARILLRTIDKFDKQKPIQIFLDCLVESELNENLTFIFWSSFWTHTGFYINIITEDDNDENITISYVFVRSLEYQKIKNILIDEIREKLNFKMSEFVYIPADVKGRFFFIMKLNNNDNKMTKFKLYLSTQKSTTSTSTTELTTTTTTDTTTITTIDLETSTNWLNTTTDTTTTPATTSLLTTSTETTTTPATTSLLTTSKDTTTITTIDLGTKTNWLNTTTDTPTTPATTSLLTTSTTTRDKNNSTEECVNLYGLNKAFGVCIKIDDCEGAGFIGNCTDRDFVCCVAEIEAVFIPDNELINQNLFLKLIGNTKRNRFLYRFFVQAMNDSEITNPYRVAAFFATLAGESDNFKYFEYRGTISANEDSVYRGRGAILLKGKNDYELATKALGISLLEEPEKVVFPSIAFKVASWYWNENAYLLKENADPLKGSINELIDGTFFNFTMFTNSLTSNLKHLKDRVNFNDRILTEINNSSLISGKGIVCYNQNDETGYAVAQCLIDLIKPYCGCEGTINRADPSPYGNYDNGNPRASPIIRCCFGDCKTVLDLTIMIDSSGSISEPDFELEKNFALRFFKSFEIIPQSTRISVIVFNTKPVVLFNFNNFTNFKNIENILNNYEYRSGTTNTGEALKVANEKIFQVENGMRSESELIPRMIIVLTDGVSNNRTYTLNEAKKLKLRNINLVTVGIGDFENDELFQMATLPQNIFTVENFDDLNKILVDLKNKACKLSLSVSEETSLNIKLGQDQYKFFKFSLLSKSDEANNETYLENFTIKLENLKGYGDFYYSFDNENPKDPDEFIDSNSKTVVLKEKNFIRKYINDRELNVRSNAMYDSEILYQITRPSNGSNEILYFSVRGREETNELEIYIYNRVVTSGINGLKFNFNLLLFFIFFYNLNQF